jgi:hypothetical protein
MIQQSQLRDSEFRYRNNPDGTWDSICLRCFLTVGTAPSIEELAQIEKAHDCYAKKPPAGERSGRP